MAITRAMHKSAEDAKAAEQEARSLIARGSYLMRYLNERFAFPRGYHCNNSTLPTQIRNIVKAVGHRYSSAGLGNALWRDFGKSQLLPKPAALLDGGYRLVDNIKRLEGTSDWELQGVLAGVASAETWRELKRVVEKQYLLAKTPKYMDMFQRLLNVCDQHNVVAKKWLSDPNFLDMLWVLAVAVVRSTDPEDVRNEWQAKINAYYNYYRECKRQAAAQVDLLDRLSSIPAELRTMVFGNLAKISFASSSWEGTEEGLAQGVETVLHPFANSMVFFQAEDGTNATLGLFKREIEEAVITSTPVRCPAQFPTHASPIRLPYPEFLFPRKHLIKHLHLQFTIPFRQLGGYPIDLYRLQDSIPNLKSFLPNLSSLQLDIVNTFIGTPADRERMGQTQEFAARMPARGLTTMEKEVGKLVQRVKLLELGERSVRLWTGNEKMIGLEAVKKDGKAMEEEELAQQMMVGDGVLFEI